MFDPTRPGPFYEDFRVGATLPPLPSVTLTDADNVAVPGDHRRPARARRRRRPATADVSGSSAALANPGIVMHYSIGQTTMATRQAIANLYYRSVRVLRPVEIGETLSTVTTVLGLKDSAPKGDQHRGKVWLGIVTSSERRPGRRVRTVRAGARRAAASRPATTTRSPDRPSRRRSPISPATCPGGTCPDCTRPTGSVGDERVDPLRDHIDLAAPLARLTFNQAAVHRDATMAANGERLVYGGHVQGLAQASLTRMLPGLATVQAWDGCDHVGPAYEGDLIEFRHRLVEQRRPARAG